MSSKNNGKETQKKRVYFKMDAPDANEVLLCGDFNQWATHSRHLKKSKNGTWSTFVMLEAGTYEYRFLVDGAWHNDPTAPERPNPYGSCNSVQIVS